MSKSYQLLRNRRSLQSRQSRKRVQFLAQKLREDIVPTKITTSSEFPKTSNKHLEKDNFYYTY